MAGTRHHYVPRWLQAGFADKGASKNSRAWEYRKAFKEPRRTATANIGLEGHFYAYGKGALRRDADPAMTLRENTVYGPLAQRLRLAEGPLTESHSVMTEFLAHLEVRTKILRDYFSEVSEHLAQEMFKVINDPVRFRGYVAQLIVIYPAFMQEILSKRGISISQDDLILLSSSMLTAPYSEQEQNVVAKFNPEFWVKVFREAIKAGHIESLLEELASEFRMARYSSCQIYIQDFPSAEFVQGESPLIFNIGGGKYTPLLVEEAGFEFAYLPLTPSRLLVIANKPLRLPPWTELRAASVTCSRSYFIAATDSENLRALLPMLGTTCAGFSADMSQVWAAEAMRESTEVLIDSDHQQVLSIVTDILTAKT